MLNGAVVACTLFAAGWYWFLAARVLIFLRTIDYLAPVKPAKDRIWPRVSLIVPACNEESTIEPAACSLLAMDYPNLELILVNDRSRDRTGEIMSELSRRDSRVQVVHVENLPVGWLGKVHALHRGVGVATGDWLLFSDADVHYGTVSLQKAVTYCESRSIGFLAVIPNFICKTTALKIFIAQFLHFIEITFSRRRLEDPSTQDAVGAGVFNLVERKAFDRSPGFAGLKMEVLDDGALAWLIKRHGAKPAVLCGFGELSLEWYRDLPALISGVEKNGFALLQYSRKAVGVYVIGACCIFILTLVVPFFCPEPSLFAVFGASAIFYFSLSGYSLWRTLRLPLWLGFTLPFSFVLFPLIILHSAQICTRQNGIYWRGTFYPLESLRREQRLRLIDLILERSKGPFGKQRV